MKVVGLMSGTSMDGIDAALVEVEGTSRSDARGRLVGFRSEPYPEDRRNRIRDAIEAGNAESLCRLNADLGEWLAEATLALLEEAGEEPSAVAAVGSHGHTVWHQPPSRGLRGASLQLGDPATVAERTGIAVISDFRARDLAAGGHGAPLVPFGDRILFALPGRPRALQNLGGMANVTWLPPRESGEEPFAFDTGPGNALLDVAAERATGGKLRFDRDGALAARGTPDPALLERLLEHPFFAQTPPRSTGRETFGAPLVDQLARERGLEPGRPQDGWPDLLATLTHLTARSIGDAYRAWILPRGVADIVLTGGGARNPELARAIRREFDGLQVHTGESLDTDPRAREAAAFALLAWAHLAGVPASVPAGTGASGPRVLGSRTPGRDARASGPSAGAP